MHKTKRNGNLEFLMGARSLIFVLCAILCTSFGASACSKDDDEPEEEETPENPPSGQSGQSGQGGQGGKWGQGGQGQSGQGCGSITLSGVCEGDVVKYCEDGVLKSYDCSQEFKICGELYDDTHSWHGCVDTGYTPNCGYITLSGECFGNVVKFCENGELKSYDCSQENKTCGDLYDDTHSWHGCVDGGYSNCGDIPASGTCFGDVVKYCENGELKSYDCTQEDKICKEQHDDTHSWSSCMEKEEPSEPCDENYKEHCNGDYFERCVDGFVLKTNCTKNRGFACVEEEHGSIGCILVDSCRGIKDRECEGDTLHICEDGQLKDRICPDWGKQCGKNANGDWDCIVAGPNGCDDYTYETHCEGNAYLKCENGKIESTSCKGGTKCYVEHKGGGTIAMCVMDECESGTLKCKGNNLMACVFGAYVPYDCSNDGLECVEDSNGGAECK